ncbi:MAG: hypothetical protein RSA99_04650, partial [Oscillospiraceae bacterium]
MSQQQKENYTFSNEPDENGFFGDFGGRFLPPELATVMQEISDEFEKAKNDVSFQKEFMSYMK